MERADWDEEEILSGLRPVAVSVVTGYPVLLGWVECKRPAVCPPLRVSGIFDLWKSDGYELPQVGNYSIQLGPVRSLQTHAVM